jgi:diguanylate cyclase (GGDEF)-like protein
MVREWLSRVQDEELRIAVSIGVASATASMSGYEALMKKAGGALYMAKRAGRDRVASTLQLTDAIGTAAK